jgi:hypothetical protein
MAPLFKLGLDQCATITFKHILSHIFQLLGSKCRLEVALHPSVLARAAPSPFAIPTTSTSLIVAPGTTYMGDLSMKCDSLNMACLMDHPNLTHLDFQSKLEISSLKFCPPNLTSLNIRNTPVKPNLSLKEMPSSLTSFKSEFKPIIQLGVESCPKTKQIKVLETPWLIYSGEDVFGICSYDVRTVRAGIRWVYDKEVPKIIQNWKSASVLALSVTVKPSGRLLENPSDVMELDVLGEETRVALLKMPGIESVSLLPPDTIWVPPNITRLNLLSVNGTYSTVCDFENDQLPTSLVHLELFMPRRFNDLWSKLPSSLTYLHIRSTSLSKEYTGPFPSGLKSLICEMEPKKNTKPSEAIANLPNSFLSVLPPQLECLKLIHCIPHWKEELSRTPTIIHPSLRVIECVNPGPLVELSVIFPNSVLQWNQLNE